MSNGYVVVFKNKSIVGALQLFVTLTIMIKIHLTLSNVRYMQLIINYVKGNFGLQNTRTRLLKDLVYIARQVIRRPKY